MERGGITLPKTWRPLGVRMASYVVGGAVLFVTAFAWFALSEHIREQFTLFQKGTVIFLGVAIAVCLHALNRCKVHAGPDGLTVVNGFRRRDFEWAEVVAIRMREGAPWATLDLADGTSCAVLAVQSADGPRALGAVRQIRALIDAEEPDAR